MSQSIKHRTASLAVDNDKRQLRILLEAMLADITALKATIAALVVDNGNRVANHNTLIAKLNLDAGVTDTNYAAATAATSSAPSDLTTIA